MKRFIGIKPFVLQTQGIDIKIETEVIVNGLGCSKIHRIIHHPVDSGVCIVDIYPLVSDLSGG